MARRTMVQCVCCGLCYTPTGNPTPEPSINDEMVYGCGICNKGESKVEMRRLKDMILSKELKGYLTPKKWLENPNEIKGYSG